MQKRAVIILAAGKGTRMNSDIPKVLHQLGRQPMIAHVLHTAQKLNPSQTIVVVGYRHELVRTALASYTVQFVLQEPQLGTAHALMQAAPALKKQRGSALVISGDVPLITEQTLRALSALHEHTNAAVTILTTHIDNPTGYGRIIRNERGKVARIIEEKDASMEVKKIKEVNAGIYIFKTPEIFEALTSVAANNAQREYYLPDVIPLLATRDDAIAAYSLSNPIEVFNINTPEQLAAVEAQLLAQTPPAKNLQALHKANL